MTSSEEIYHPAKEVFVPGTSSEVRLQKMSLEYLMGDHTSPPQVQRTKEKLARDLQVIEQVRFSFCEITRGS